MARKREKSQTADTETPPKEAGGFFENFELRNHLLSLIDSFLEYIETLLLYLRKSAQEKVKRGIQAYIFLKIGLYFLGIGVLLFLAALFLFFLKTFGGDFLLASLGTGGVCIGFSFLSLGIAASRFKK